MTVAGGRLYARAGGAVGLPAVVTIHSGLAHSRMWDPLATALHDDAFVIAYDCRCFGRSTTDLDGPYSDLADLAAVLDAFGLGSAVLVGTSRGARIAIDFALAHPERVRGLFLVAPDVSGFDAPATDAERALQEAIGAADEAWEIEDLIDNELRLFVDGPTRDAAGGRAELRARVAEMSRVNYAQQRDTPGFTELDPPAAGRLSELACPVRVLVGEADTSGMIAMSAAVERDCPQADLVRIADTAHMLVLERPAEVERELRSWLRTVPPPPAR